MAAHRIVQGDCLEGLRTLPDASVHCCVTSPPYWGLRSYLPDGHDDKHLERGLEQTPEEYVARMVEVFREVRRVLRDDGTCWVNLGDSYANTWNGGGGGKASSTLGAMDGKPGRGVKQWEEGARGSRVLPPGLKPKDLVGIPWRVAFALQADGWWLRQDIIWHKPNPMPESVRDRCTKAHEYVFLLTKSERYFYDAEAVSEASVLGPHVRNRSSNFKKAGKEAFGRHLLGAEKIVCDGTRNRRSVWTVTTKPYSGAHFAVMPPDLVEPCIKAGCLEQCCPVCGKGWERVVVNHGYSKADKPSKRKAAGSNPSNQGDAMRCVGGGHWVKETLGWQPACDCVASGTIPGTVLDPFAGSGTTLAVAAELGRNAIGCELNPEYIVLAKQRIAKSTAKMALFSAK